MSTSPSKIFVSYAAHKRVGFLVYCERFDVGSTINQIVRFNNYLFILPEGKAKKEKFLLHEKPIRLHRGDGTM